MDIRWTTLNRLVVCLTTFCFSFHSKTLIDILGILCLKLTTHFIFQANLMVGMGMFSLSQFFHNFSFHLDYNIESTILVSTIPSLLTSPPYIFIYVHGN